jgi:hypothetical protein
MDGHLLWAVVGAVVGVTAPWLGSRIAERRGADEPEETDLEMVAMTAALVGVFTVSGWTFGPFSVAVAGVAVTGVSSLTPGELHALDRPLWTLFSRRAKALPGADDPSGDRPGLPPLD